MALWAAVNPESEYRSFVTVPRFDVPITFIDLPALIAATSAASSWDHAVAPAVYIENVFLSIVTLTALSFLKV